jgi:hypothetical protein
MTTHDDFFPRSTSSEGSTSQADSSVEESRPAGSPANGLLRDRSPFAGPYSGRLADLAGDGRVTLLSFDWFGRRSSRIRNSIAALAAAQVPRLNEPGDRTVIAAFGEDRGLLDALSAACGAEAEVEAVLLKMSGETEGGEIGQAGVSLLTGIDLLARSNGVGQLFGYASRLLRPGGRLVLVDFFLRDDLNCSDLDEGDRLSLENLSRLRLNAPLKTASQLDWLAGRFDLEPIEQKSMKDIFPLERRRSGLGALLGSVLGSWRGFGRGSARPTNRQDYSSVSGRDALSRCLERDLVEIRMRVWQRLKPVSLEVEDTETVH